MGPWNTHVSMAYIQVHAQESVCLLGYLENSPIIATARGHALTNDVSNHVTVLRIHKIRMLKSGAAAQVKLVRCDVESRFNI